ncbi:hypothetical protein E4U43_004258 [Claviceps pusilla]|uniref:Cat eye syndrome critical region protein 5 n=1 Tax=Claviceps pusilla TaxID=123648 RepID=A0A9P7N3M1_9HYPO|nr:hypothetical protein E4U43_004258 [Claviceps pusilla]
MSRAAHCAGQWARFPSISPSFTLASHKGPRHAHPPRQQRRCIQSTAHGVGTPRSRAHSSLSPSTRTGTPRRDGGEGSVFSDIAFAFDIDGVLYRGAQGIPGAREMLRSIRAKDIRYVFLTNGGGAHEDAKVASLTKRLGLSMEEDVIRDRVILSHTPMRAWADEVKRQTVLITGSHPETARRIANEYGFSRAVTPADLIHDNHNLYPFDNLKDTLHSEFRPLPDGKSAAAITDPYSTDIAPQALKIDRILVWNDPRDWSLDIQVIHDLLVSHRGYIGTISSQNGRCSLPNNGWQQDGQPELWISNLDLVWKTEHPVNRFGTGAFLEALRGVWSAVTDGAELQYHALGKPSQFTYDYAHTRLLEHYSRMEPAANRRSRTLTDGTLANGTPATGTPAKGTPAKGTPAKGTPAKDTPLRRVYMIGDNPESDIRGANEFCPHDGTEWVSILVKTGVWQETAAAREPRYKPAVIVDDVVDAIVWAMRNEGVAASRRWLLEGGK